MDLNPNMKQTLEWIGFELAKLAYMHGMSSDPKRNDGMTNTLGQDPQINQALLDGWYKLWHSVNQTKVA